MTRRALLIMAKQPRPGFTKTRLQSVVTPEQAAHLYECFLRDVIELARTLTQVETVLAYTPAAAASYFVRLAPDLLAVAQQGCNLGYRLDNVLGWSLANGFDQAVAINSDSPSLPPEYASRAFARLDRPSVDVVLGPSEDGGYYLIGWKQRHSRLVCEVPMSTTTVLADTLSLAAELGLSVSLLPQWYDVDGDQDLARLWQELQTLPETSRRAHHTRRFLAQEFGEQDVPGE